MTDKNNSESQKEIDRILKLAKSSPTMFQILDIDPSTATVQIVKKQHTKLVLLTHPDKVSIPNAGDAFALVTRAYKLLSNEVLLKRAIEASAKHAGLGAAAGSNKDGEIKMNQQEEEEKAKERLREEYLAAVRAQEERQRIRQRENAERAETEQEKEDIRAAAEAWKKCKLNATSKI
jgi:curved DNA-binding protein CbpA